MIASIVPDGWWETEAFPALWTFFRPLIAWILISIVAPLVRYRLDRQLWLYNKKHHDTHPEPKFAKYLNTVVNCLLIVLVATICKMTFGITIGLTVVSSVILIIFAAVQVTKCINTYLKLEDVGFSINIYKIFKKGSFGDVIEKDKKE